MHLIDEAKIATKGKKEEERGNGNLRHLNGRNILSLSDLMPLVQHVQGAWPVIEMLVHKTEEVRLLPSTLETLVAELLGSFRQETTCDRAVCVEGDVILADKRQNIILCETRHSAVASLEDRRENKGLFLANL